MHALTSYCLSNLHSCPSFLHSHSELLQVLEGPALSPPRPSHTLLPVLGKLSQPHISWLTTFHPPALNAGVVFLRQACYDLVPFPSTPSGYTPLTAPVIPDCSPILPSGYIESFSGARFVSCFIQEASIESGISRC